MPVARRRLNSPAAARKNPGTSWRVGVAVSMGIMVAACSGPPLDPEVAAAQVAGRLPGATVEVVGTEDDGGHRIVAVEASGEPMRFSFRYDGDAWRIDRFEDGSGALVDLQAASDAWREVLRTPRGVTLRTLATEGRPAAPLEVLVTGLRIETITADRIVLVDASNDQELPVRIDGGNLDRLPLQPGLEVSIQVGDLERGDDGWHPIRPETPADILPLLEQLDVVLLQMLKVRHANGAVPIPYR